MRRSCAQCHGGHALFQFGCDGVNFWFPGRAWESEELRDKSCTHAAKDLSNKEETTRMGQAGPVSRKGLVYRLPSRKAFPHLGLCAGRPRMKSAKSCIKLWARGGYQRCSALANGSSHPPLSCLPLRPLRLGVMLLCSFDRGEKPHAKAQSSQSQLINPQESARKGRGFMNQEMD